MEDGKAVNTSVGKLRIIREKRVKTENELTFSHKNQTKHCVIYVVNKYVSVKK